MTSRSISSKGNQRNLSTSPKHLSPMKLAPELPGSVGHLGKSHINAIISLAQSSTAYEESLAALDVGV